MNTIPKRVSPIHVPDEYRLPERPESPIDSVLDAFRQTQFVLGSELRLFAEEMNLQLQIMRDAYPSQYRTLALAGIAGVWSRAYQCLADAAMLLTHASYGASLPMLQSTLEMIAAEAQLVRDSTTFVEWSEGTLTASREYAAFEFALGRVDLASTIESDPELRALYQVISDLSAPHFGATLLLIAPDSNNQRLALTFGDASFHLGWAEMVLGWLQRLAMEQIRIALESVGVFPISDEVALEVENLGARVEAALARDDRCYVEQIDHGGARRYLVHNFRRTSGGAPKKILL